MSADRILMLRLLGDTTSMDRSLRKSEGTLKSFGRSVARWGTAAFESFAITGVETLVDALGNAWDGFRSGQQVAAQLGTTWKNLGMDGSKLGGVLDELYASTRALGTSDDEAVMAFNKALQATGNSVKAMQRLKIAQDLVANGSAPNLNSAMGLIQQAAKGSSRVVDRFGLKSKTAGGRVKELGERVKGAAKKKAALDPMGVLFNAMNEDLEGIVGALTSGDLSGAMDNLGKISDDIATAWEKIYKNAIPVLDKLAGGQKLNQLGVPGGEGSGSQTADMLGDIIEKVRQLGGEVAQPALDTLANLTGLMQQLQPVAQALSPVLTPITDFLKTLALGASYPILGMPGDIFKVVTDILKGDFKTAVDDAGKLVGNLLKSMDRLVQEIPSKLIDALPRIADGAANIGNAIFHGISDAVYGVVGVGGSVVGGIVSVVTGAVEGVVDAITGIIDAAGQAAADLGAAIYSGVINAIKDLAEDVAAAWNSLGGFGAGSVHIFDGGSFGIPGTPLYTEWGPLDVSWSGGDLIPNIAVPALAKGGIVSSPTLAMIGEAGPEAVVPLGRGGGMGGNTYNVHVSVAPGADLVEAGRQMVRAIQQYERRSGKVWRSA